MPPSTYKIGPGVFQIGTDPDQLDMALQTRSLTITPAENVTEEEDIDVLSGDVVLGEDAVTHSHTVTATVLQDTLQAGGMIDFTFTHAGETLPYRYVPRDGVTRAVEGLVRVVPITIGGDNKARPESSFTWQGKGLPALVDVAP